MVKQKLNEHDLSDQYTETNLLEPATEIPPEENFVCGAVLIFSMTKLKKNCIIRSK